ncbi:hypothetical protein AGMMS50229_09950 [Campylobacterota bacterium]|nr:hypothetical protein AGMMS50229_09950 [Campylobacterota bacterium]
MSNSPILNEVKNLKADRDSSVALLAQNDRRTTPLNDKVGASNDNWIKTGILPDSLSSEPIKTNNYFVAHPENMLGSWGRYGGMHSRNAANAKIGEINRAWQDWILQDGETAKRLTREYNDRFNSTVNREFDGSHLVLPNKVDDEIITLRPHQKNAIWRIIQSPTTLLDHTVGSGKTFTIVAAAHI